MTFNPSLKNALLFFAIGVLFGLFMFFLWGQMLIPEYKPVTQKDTPQELVKQVAKAETIYAEKADSLKSQSKQLQTELSASKVALRKANEKTVALRSQMFELLDQRFEEKQYGNTDTLCDSLANEVPILIAASEEKDSLYNVALVNLERQVENRDSTIALQDEQYAELKSAFTKSIEAQTTLTSENKALTKSIKRQRTKSKIVSAAVLILSGAAVNFLLRR